ncbi:MAG: spore coat polysaccharide biosynthesis protein SpsF [Actinomycetota bacterium]|nr:spore coat polysaccharide biosynthesis protein SpsF [Actinomycetota bacterium]
MNRVGVVTQARTGSTRLPGKVLIEAAGRTMLDHHLDRLIAAGLDVYVATTDSADDDRVADLAQRRGIAVFRGSEEDVLSRFAGCVRAHDLDVVVRVTSDCPLIDGGVVADGVTRFLQLREQHGDDVYLSNTLERTYPRGFDFEVVAGSALLRADREATAGRDREHVTPWLYAGPHRMPHIVQVRRSVDRSSYRVTLDTVEDLELIRRLFEDHDAATLDCDGVIAVLDAHPELVALNADVAQRELG